MKITEYHAANDRSTIGVFRLQTDKGYSLMMKHQKKDKGDWVSFQACAYDTSGEKKFAPSFSFDLEEHNKLFLKRVKELLDEYLQKKPDDNEVPF